MFKTSLTASAFALIAGLSHAAPGPQDLTLDTAASAPAPAPAIAETAQFDELAYYCEWVTVYDYWGNWMTVWQCY